MANKKVSTKKETPLTVGVVLLEVVDSFNVVNMVEELKTKWGLEVERKEESSEETVLQIEEYTITISTVESPIEDHKLSIAAEYSNYWKTATQEISKHTGYIKVTLQHGAQRFVAENILLNQVLAAILTTSTSLGVYMMGRNLVVEKGFYLENTALIEESSLPLYNWLYFGFGQSEGKSSFYTYGLSAFEKPEFEIVHSRHSLEALNDLMLNIVDYVLESDITFQHNDTVSISETQKLKIKYSKGEYVRGKTLKVVY